MNRYTFVIKVHPGGISTLENLSTSERVRVSDLASVGSQIERWLVSLPSSSSAAAPAPDAEAPSPPAPPG